MKKTYIYYILIIALALALPYFMDNQYYLRLAVVSGLFILLASAHNILMKVGQLSLGPVAFYGLGAYTSAILTTRYGMPFVVGFLAAGLMAALAGWLIGRLTLKMRKAYFVLVTIGFAEFFRLVALNWDEVTNGPMGITAIPAPASWFVGYAPYYYTILFLVVVVLFVLSRIENSSIGRAMQAIRENETLSLSVGIDSYRMMMFAAVLSSVIIGFAGSFYAHFFRFLGPEVLVFDLTITIVVMVIAGGRGTLAGPVLGAILFTIIPEVLRAATVWRMAIYGALLVLIMLYMPDGILPAMVSLYEKGLAALRSLASRWLPGRVTPITQPSSNDGGAVVVPNSQWINPEDEKAEAIMSLAARAELDSVHGSAIPGTDGNGSTEAQHAHAKLADHSPKKDRELLRVNDLCVNFGGVRAVDHVSFSINQGEILAVIGPNGAGKTTLLNAITRLGPITSGSITYQGQDITNLPPYEVACRKVIRTFQHTSVFPTMTTRRNLILAHNQLESHSLLANVFRNHTYHKAQDGCHKKADQLLELLNLTNYANVRANSLPYGDQRLLELGIALTVDPVLLLLDEPAAGMNAVEVETLMELIQRIRDMGITILLVEHDMKLVMGISDRLLVLNYGCQIAAGTPEEIQQNEEVVTAYLGKGRTHAQSDER
jgi:branched-chain amino acid transport system permease protein